MVRLRGAVQEMFQGVDRTTMMGAILTRRRTRPVVVKRVKKLEWVMEAGPGEKRLRIARSKVVATRKARLL
jgi:hypothetical protein